MNTGYQKPNAYIVENRGVWHIKIKYKNPNTGKWATIQRSTKIRVEDDPEKRLANRYLGGVLSDLEKEINTDYRGPRTEFSKYVVDFLQQQKTQVSESTMMSYEGYARKHILPALGDMRVNKITPRVLQNFVNEKYEEGMSPESIKKINVVVKGALRLAELDGTVPPGMILSVKYPRKATAKVEAYSEQELVEFVNLLMTQAEEPIRAYGILTACYGLRRSEACGLRWSDIDFESGVMHIQNARSRSREGYIDTETTKTVSSNRILKLLPSTVEYFKELKAQHERDGIDCGHVCVSYETRKCVSPDIASRSVMRFMDRNNLRRIKVHSLRKSVNSVGMDNGVSPMAMSRTLGHSNLDTTCRKYYTVTSEEQYRISQKLDSVLFKDISSA